MSCELTKDQWKSFFRATPLVIKKGSPIETKAVFIIEVGNPGDILVSGTYSFSRHQFIAPMSS